MARYFEDFRTGEEFVTPRRTITEADVVTFAGVSGDSYALHTDEAFARGTVFRGRIAHGLLTLAAATGLWHKLGFFEDGATRTLVAFYGIDNLRFTAPVRPGDSIGLRLRVVRKEAKGSNGLVSLLNEAYTQDGTLVLTFVARLLLERRERS